ncbi:GatB/YqeY domain-containing protein [Agrobacterium vitis]|uniref:GatB/YqeY domain-containing protein n=1 Tax=Agrobacterium vitis TaxID=373 RepID=UPI0012E7B521|nr:GatB/YqeY domain-containing protein [Agrobacterium vitis]MUZ64394.1 GatB/YqeY domain-containing protein [Agrobacterium vitis]
MLREDLTTALKEAMKAKDSRRLSTIRLVQSAIKDRDIANRGEGKDEASDDDILQLMAKLVKQREESAKIYEDNARPELAAQERDEVAIIKGFMPEQMDDAKVREAISGIITEISAEGVRDMGKVMAALKERYAGQMDFAKASGLVKELLTK